MSGALTQFSLNRLTVGSQTCAYVASKDDPGSWHGIDSAEFGLDRDPVHGGLGIFEWRCPHPPLGQDHGDEEYCVFHTDMEVSADYQRQKLLEALKEAGEGPQDDRPEHRGQFVGATFGAINLSGETIRATDDYGIRFDHARFQAKDDHLEFKDTTFTTQGQYSVSFNRAEFITDGDGHVKFLDATFRTTGNGSVWFNGVTFRTDGDSHVRFNGATFRTDDAGHVGFNGATFRTTGDGSVWFSNAVFRTVGGGHVWFSDATFKTDGDGNVEFGDATFRTDGDGHVRFDSVTFRTDNDSRVKFLEAMFMINSDGSVWFDNATFRINGDNHILFNGVTFRTDGDGHVRFFGATFRIDGDGYVEFNNATFRINGDGHVGFNNAMFRINGDGHVGFGDTTLTNADFRHVDFGEADLRGAELTGADLREANIADVSVNSATTCKRLYEGYGTDRVTLTSISLPRLKELYEGSQFAPEEWDATARSYHDLKSVFSGYGLVGKARSMHIWERRARRLETKAAYSRFDRRYLRSLPSWIVTGYGVRVQTLAFWMLALFLCSTGVYVVGGVNETLMENISYSVLAFTVAPPEVPEGVGTQVMMMVETFFGTLSIVLLGYILGNRERF